MSKHYAVKVGQSIFQPKEQSDANRMWASALVAAHKKDLTHCLCNPTVPTPLTIRHYGAETKRSRYALACWPGTGLEHALDCQYFGEDDESGEHAGTKPAFEDMDGSLVRVYLARSTQLVERTKAETATPSSGSKTAAATRQRANDSALLSTLWRRANLNRFHNVGANWFKGSLRVMHAARKLVIDRAGTTLDQRLLLGANVSSVAAAQHNAQVLAKIGQKPEQLFVIGRWRLPKPEQLEKRAFFLPFKDFYGLPKILIDREMANGFLEGRDFLTNILNKKEGDVIVLCRIVPSGEWWKCIDITGFATNQQLIPVESSYELLMVNHLIDNERQFIKPMHVEEMGEGSDQRPDFILVDTAPKTMVEVWGMRTPEYLAKKAERLAKYAAARSTVLSWMADQGDEIPRLPPVSI